MAIPTVTGTKWTAYAIREVIKNQTYIGKINTKTVRCKKSMMLERACEAYETGIYDRQTYLERVQKVNAARAELQARVEELEVSIEESEERHQKAVPILTRVVEEMHTLEPKEQNDLLKMIIDRIEYEKTESGAAIGIHNI